MKQIVIAVDGTAASVTAAKTAHRLFGDDAHYVAVHVQEALPIAHVTPVDTTRSVGMPAGWDAGSVTHPVTQLETAEYEQDPVELAQSIASRVVAEAGLPSAEAVGTVGDETDAILEIVRERNPDVLVLGAHEHGWFSRLFGGSLADDVRKHTDIPTLIVPVPVTEHDDRRITDD